MRHLLKCRSDRAGLAGADLREGGWGRRKANRWGQRVVSNLMYIYTGVRGGRLYPHG